MSTLYGRGGRRRRLLRRAGDGRLDRVRRRGAALGDLALRELGGLVDYLQRDRWRVDAYLARRGVDLRLGLRLRGGGGLVDLGRRLRFGGVCGLLAGGATSAAASVAVVAAGSAAASFLPRRFRLDAARTKITTPMAIQAAGGSSRKNSMKSILAAIKRSDVVAMNSSKGVAGGGMTLRPYAIVSRF